MEFLEEIISLPSYVSAYGWIPFSVVIVMSLLFSFIYVKHFWSRTERDKCSGITATLGISIALLAAFLLPVDVFLASFMKNSDGSFKEWAVNTTREALENTVTYTYYSVYGIIFVYSFFILPLVYFAYEERDEEYRSSVNVCTRALLYTLIFLLVISTMLLAGAFMPFKTAPGENSTQWDKIEFLVDSLYENRGRDALAFVVHMLTLYGMLNLVIYTGVGLASFPLTLMKGFRPLSEEELIISESHATTQSKINALRSKQSRQSLSSREVAQLCNLEEEESLLSRRSQLLESKKKSISHKLGPILRLVNAICGVVGIIFSIILWISLLISNIDKLLHSLGYKMGYTLTGHLLPNPLDYIMVQAQKVFPLDYILFFSIIIFLVMCTVSAMRSLGICCLCVPMYKVRPGRTQPQGLILLSFILMFTVFAFHILIFSVIPTYATFGSQYYCKGNGTVCDLQTCTLDAPPDDCTMTRSASFLLTFAYKAWIFSSAYFWMTWGFLATFLLSLIVTLMKSRRSSLEEAIDKDDFDDSYDDRMIKA